MTELPLNPGIAQTFPWMSQMADAYEEYRIKGMAFQFKSTSGEFVLNSVAGGSSGALGTVVMATNYNAAVHPAFTDKKSMENYEFAQSAPPTRSMVHYIESKGPGTPVKTLYLRTGAKADDTDIRLYDIGTFAIATQGMIAEVDNATIGELWVAYEVEFFKPRYRVSGGKTDHYSLRWDPALPASGNLVGGCVAGKPFGTAPVIDRTRPVVGPNNPNNGVFAAGSKIRPGVGAGSLLYMPENPGAVYKITVAVKTSDVFAVLRADGNEPIFTVTGNPSVEQINNWCGDWLKNNVEAPSHVAPIGGSASRDWSLTTIWKVLPHDAASLPYVLFDVANGVDAATAHTVDVILEEINIDYYTNPSS